MVESGAARRKATGLTASSIWSIQRVYLPAGRFMTGNKRWDASLYDGKHSFVWKYGGEVIDLLSPQGGERILDLGCGTGHLTHQIALSGAELTGMDLSPAMIGQARKNYPDLRFVVADGVRIPFAEVFDAVFSNAALHWMRKPAQVVACIASVLKRGGRFVAEFGGKGNVQALHAALETAGKELGFSGLRFSGDETLNRRYFPSVGEYSGLLERHGLAVRSAALFDRPTPLEEGENGVRNWLEMFAGDFLAAIPRQKRQDLIRSVEDRLRPVLFQDGTWFADYRRLRIVAIRE